ncbi:hypothetical protein VA7868_02332 [Vibrio aerogenes CECT 7868]|uniref:Uncharacterized protein n=1 Tax=Vibrio aerogenes CECT 7868 TaxID=1216006 RepID=A0A1M5Z623_9VIBR|nr:hypothetical protein [Vibrio aerogenes]SHI19669.1 hypothetical protein VA7868_02332 [Vibrio aerogenes CECT 7868]
MTTVSDTTSISREAREEDGQNLPLLQQQALTAIQQYAGEQWTDHNPADPGITLLEVLTFVISDLSYRLGFPLRDLMAWPPAGADSAGEPFWLAPQILPSNGVTLQDYQRIIMDISGIRAVMLAQEEDTGRLSVTVDTEANTPTTYARRQQLAHTIRQRFLAERNINDDIARVRFIKKHQVTLELALEFGPLSDPVSTIAEVLSMLQQTISPDVTRQTLGELLDAGQSADSVFEGPYTERGFIDDEALESVFPQTLYASDLIASLETIISLKRVRHLTFSGPDTQADFRQNKWVSWQYMIDTDGNSDPESIILNTDATLDALSIEIDGQTFPLSDTHKTAIKALLAQTDSDDQTSDTDTTLTDLNHYQQGQYRMLSHYRSLQHEFPAVYQLASQRLDGDIDSAELATIMQLKGFLTLFDQILADQFAQLETLKVLLALPGQSALAQLAGLFDKMLASEFLSAQDRITFWQAVKALPATSVSQPVTGISGMANLLGTYFTRYQQQGFQQQAEPPFSDWQLERLNLSLSHLMARYAETTPDANLLRYHPVFAFYLTPLKQAMPASLSQTETLDDQTLLQRLVQLKQVVDKAMILSDYPRLSRLRAGGFNYLSSQPCQDFSPALTHRILRFLGVTNTAVMPLATRNREGLYLVESALLWAGETDGLPVSKNTLYVIIPDWPTRFRHTRFRQLLAGRIRQETPVHLTVKWIALERETMSNFEQLYYAWLNAMSRCPLEIDYGDDATGEPVPAHQIQDADQNWLTELSQRLNQFLHEPDTLVILPEQYHPTIGEATIRQNFRVGYQPLDFLHPITELSKAVIHPSDQKNVFCVDIQQPNIIKE